MGHDKAFDKGKKKQKRGLWSPDEDQRLRNYILKHGHGCWSNVSINAGLQRNGKSCRLRWLNYLRPGLKRGMFSREEEEIVLNLHKTLGNKWSRIAHKLPGRTDNEIKNYWHSYLKKKVAKMGETEGQGNAECMNLHNESSSLKSSLESIEHIEGPLVNSCAQKSNLPRILFAEWLPLDQFVGRDSDCLTPDTYKYALENSGSNSQDVFMHDLLLNEGTFACEMQPNLSSSIDDMFQEQFKFEQQKSESGFAELFTGEFNINYDVMYI